MTNITQENTNNKTKISPVTNKIISSAITITIITAVCYYIGKLYTDSYLARLGIPSQWIEFSTTHYIEQAIPAVAIFFIFSLLPVVIGTLVKNDKRRIYVDNISILIITLLLIYIAFSAYTKIVAYILSISILIGSIFIYIKLFKLLELLYHPVSYLNL